jgi:hypothetical protein
LPSPVGFLQVFPKKTGIVMKNALRFDDGKRFFRFQNFPTSEVRAAMIDDLERFPALDAANTANTAQSLPSCHRPHCREQ